MWRNKTFDEVTDLLLARRLGRAVDLLENHLLSHQSQHDMEQLLLIKNDFHLLADYWQKGYADPQREQLYDQLLRRVYLLATNMAIHDRIRNTPFIMAVYQRPRQARKDWSMRAVREALEGFVSGVAMLTLEPENVRSQKEEQLYREHQQLMNDLFDYIWTSRLWKDSLAEAFEEILLSPTVDSLDQQLIVSAITLSAMNSFGFNKFRVLTRVYQQATDERLRQRALVGWVFCADERKAALYPEMRQIVATLCQDERVRKELTELQMQMHFCMNAEDDTQKIKNEIMPDLIKGNNLRITRHGIVEQEDDQLEDILHPDAAERSMERMEESMRKMADMQKQGSDIYFAGFSQMKRFPFFNDISNWFVPFYAHHPGISSTWNQSRGQRFLHTIMKLGAFCDSDQYSFVLAFNVVLERLPKQMLQMIEQGEALPMPVGGEVGAEEQRQPAFMRRLYLQNLYRFFRLYPQRGEFFSPFDEQASIFFANGLFRGTLLEDHMVEVASFLSKHRRYDAAIRVLDNMSPERQDDSYNLMQAGLLMRRQGQDGQVVVEAALALYRKVLASQPRHQRALMGYARASFRLQKYGQALEAYEQLLAIEPEQPAVQLNMAVCLSNLKRYDEALKLLYKLNYLDEENENVMRVLAWTLTAGGKFAQAVKLYDRLLSAESPQPSDLLNYGFCLWLSGDVMSAVGMMRQFLSDQKDEQFSMEHELLFVERELLSEHGITDTEILLMLDALQS